MFWGRDKETELERRLRAERPQAPDQLVRRLSAQLQPKPPARRSIAPRIALIAAVTGALVLSLGVAGAIGSATGSIHAFGRGAYHLVQPPAAHSASDVVTPNHDTGGQDPLDPRFWLGREFGPPPPFSQEYGGRIPICYHGQIIYVNLLEYFWYFTHGGLPARDCFIR
jgi:hypothetical protein